MRLGVLFKKVKEIARRTKAFTFEGGEVSHAVAGQNGGGGRQADRAPRLQIRQVSRQYFYSQSSDVNLLSNYYFYLVITNSNLKRK